MPETMTYTSVFFSHTNTKLGARSRRGVILGREGDQDALGAHV